MKIKIYADPQAFRITNVNPLDLITLQKEMTAKVGDFSFEYALSEPLVTDNNTLILYGQNYYLNASAFALMNGVINNFRRDKALLTNKVENLPSYKIGINDEATRDQVAAIMLLKGSPSQQIEALEYAGAHSLAEAVKIDLAKTASFNAEKPIKVHTFFAKMMEVYNNQQGKSEYMRVRFENGVLSFRFVEDSK